MTLTPANVGITLTSLLAARESRAARQAEWLTGYNQPIISLTLVTPGAVKDSFRYRNTMKLAIQECEAQLQRHRWPVLKRQVLWLETGPEALWCVAHPAEAIKAECVRLEQTSPLGRLWDFDLLCPRKGQIGRHSLNLPSRPCLVCNRPAHGCARSRRHPPEEVVARVEKLIDDWFYLNPG